MNSSITGYKIKNRKSLRHWAVVLEEWLLINERYARVMGGDDAGYLYNETTDVSTLLAAAWRAGWIGLSEFSTTKEKEGKEKYGRGDLWLNSEAGEELIEAKRAWVRIKNGNAKEAIEVVMEKAFLDAMETKGSHDVRGVAIGIFPVWGKVDLEKDDLVALIDEFVDRLDSIDYHFVAWCFPEAMRKHVNENSGNWLPGVVMLGKNVGL